jgi:hypothetical protein
MNMLFGRQSGVLIMFDHLEKNEPERKHAEHPDQTEADQGATKPATPFHRWEC